MNYVDYFFSKTGIAIRVLTGAVLLAVNSYFAYDYIQDGEAYMLPLSSMGIVFSVYLVVSPFTQEKERRERQKRNDIALAALQGTLQKMVSSNKIRVTIGGYGSGYNLKAEGREAPVSAYRTYHFDSRSARTPTLLGNFGGAWETSEMIATCYRLEGIKHPEEMDKHILTCDCGIYGSWEVLRGSGLVARCVFYGVVLVGSSGIRSTKCRIEEIFIRPDDFPTSKYMNFSQLSYDLSTKYGVPIHIIKEWNEVPPLPLEDEKLAKLPPSS